MGISREVFDSRIENDEQGIVGFTQVIGDLEAGFQAINDTLFPWLEKLSSVNFKAYFVLEWEVQRQEGTSLPLSNMKRTSR